MPPTCLQVVCMCGDIPLSSDVAVSIAASVFIESACGTRPPRADAKQARCCAHSTHAQRLHAVAPRASSTKTRYNYSWGTLGFFQLVQLVQRARGRARKRSIRPQKQTRGFWRTSKGYFSIHSTKSCGRVRKGASTLPQACDLGRPAGRAARRRRGCHQRACIPSRCIAPLSQLGLKASGARWRRPRRSWRWRWRASFLESQPAAEFLLLLATTRFLPSSAWIVSHTRGTVSMWGFETVLEPGRVGATCLQCNLGRILRKTH